MKQNTNVFYSKFNTLKVLAALLFMMTISQFSLAADPGSVTGRWDLTVQIDNEARPSWLEVKLSGIKTLVGHFVGEVGSARPISQVFFADGKISFRIPPQWDNSEKDMLFEGTLANDKITGTITSSTGKEYPFVGVRAPQMARDNMSPEWGKPITLFTGSNLENWHAQNAQNQWVAEDGILKSPKPGSNLISDQKFGDFKLHIEFKYPKGGNSGIYLRGRYEVQCEDSYGKEPSSIYLGGVYGFLSPNENVAKQAGEWQTYDITLIGRRVTIVANGKTVICDQIIPGITGGAIDSNEGEPGPIMLQGDHLPVEFRNIVITPAK